MQRVEFRTVRQQIGDGVVVDAIVPHLEGVPLPELLRRVELPSARRERAARTSPAAARA